MEELQDKPIKMNTHEGQEMDYVLEGTLKIMVNGKTEILNAGDCIYYDSSLPLRHDSRQRQRMQIPCHFNKLVIRTKADT